MTLCLGPVTWLLQTFGAFPTRGEPAPAMFYALTLAAALLLAGLAFKAASRGERLAAMIVAVTGLAVPLVATGATYSRIGAAWQGRYGLPLTLGFFLLCGYALDRRPARLPDHVALAAVMLMTVTADVIAQLQVLRHELVHSPLAHSSEWFRVPSYIVAMLVALGVALQCWAMWQVKSARGRRAGSIEAGEVQPALATGRGALK